MNVALRKPLMTREEFFAWAERQDARFEFDGFQPVAMSGGVQRHNLIALSIHRALHARLKGSKCYPLGMDAGIATVDEAVRYPDALVTCTKASDDARLVPAPVVAFEVLSPSSGRTDHIEKLREYGAVESILRYSLLEYTSIGLTSFERRTSSDSWVPTALTADDVPRLPEIGIEVPVSAFYEDVELLKTEE